MIKGDTVKVRFWEGAPTFNNVIGTIEDWREVGKRLENIDYEYLVRFGDGSGLWIPSRYVRQTGSDGSL